MTSDNSDGFDRLGAERGSVDASSRPVAIVAGQPLSAGDVFPVMAELAGSQALREIALDLRLEEELRRRGIELTDELVESERNRLGSPDSPGLDTASELTRTLLDRRGLGPKRLGNLLRRNASLRLLIDRPALPSAEIVRTAYNVRHGPQRRVRVAVFNKASEAASAAASTRTEAEAVGAVAAFGSMAIDRSIDPSSAAGGLLGEVSVFDPGLPAVLRRVIASIGVGQISDIVALERGFALVLVEADIPGDGTPLETVRDSLVEQISERTARLAMEELAENLILSAQITPIEPGLRWSWDRRPASVGGTTR